jgi:hypothetical protein
VIVAGEPYNRFSRLSEVKSADDLTSSSEYHIVFAAAIRA